MATNRSMPRATAALTAAALAASANSATSATQGRAAPKSKPDEGGKGLCVVARRDGFRRAGRAFGAEPVVIPLADLSDLQYHQLTTEPMLVTYLVDLPADDAATETATA